MDEPDLDADSTTLVEALRGIISSAAIATWKAVHSVWQPTPSLQEAIERTEASRLRRLAVSELKALARQRGVDTRGVLDKDDLIRGIIAAGGS